ncbi:MAG: hypothetical protein IID41_14250 [Planctomycetes bacterium]|nr:hypothetical protein [Planctomycetota bacterium]
MLSKIARIGLAIGVAACGTGCASGAYLDLSASQVLRSIAGEMKTTVEEYQADLAAADEQREVLAIHAFLARVRQAERDSDAMAKDGVALEEALAKIRADRAVAVERYVVTRANIDLLVETADGLQHNGLARLSVGRSLQNLLTTKE